MRIPLDYYRILGLPAQATPEQLQQAHRDRVLQLPRREYSEAAITARRELLDEAFGLLANPLERQVYDERFLKETTPLSRSRAKGGVDSADTAQTPYLEIEDRQLVGALLLLQELGEYEYVLKYGTVYLSKNRSRSSLLGDQELVGADIVLTVALAHLELGREYWQQSQYERAAESLEAGQDLLLREGLFASVRGEIRSDLFRLRPYRILELVSQSLDQSSPRRKGLQILRDMLQERGGIDGHGDDQSGLSVDDFLRFVQQLRDYLTAQEQQELFETESRRPSAVASYLAVYALMARGFADHQPELVKRAKTMLVRLGKRQDVHLEQSICALMLGQTDEASRALEMSQEYEPLAFIREHSNGSPDLLPGLCLYAERWLQEEVFPHFRDLSKKTASLKGYFADLNVQTYLESLSSEPVTDQWEVVPAVMQTHGVVDSRGATLGAAGLGAVGVGMATPGMANQAMANQAMAQAVGASGNPGAYGMAGSQGRGTATLEVPPLSAVAGLAGAAGLAAAGRNGGGGVASGGASSAGLGAVAFAPGGAGENGPDGARARRVRRTGRRPQASGGASLGGRSLRYGRLALLFLAGAASLGLFIWLLSLALGWINGRSASVGRTQKLEREPLMISLNEPLIEGTSAPLQPSKVATDGPLTPAAAQQVIELWLREKVKALGPQHQADGLVNVLSADALSYWQEEVSKAKEDQISIEFTHRVTVEGVEVTPEKPDEAVILATVSEIAKYTQNAGLLSSRDDRNLAMRYEVVREEGVWRIRLMNVRS